MFADQWSKVVVASVAPVVVISASGLLCLAFYNRLAAIVSRLRAVQRERMAELTASRSALDRGSNDLVRGHQRMLRNLGDQTNHIIKRARLIRLTLLCLLATIGQLVLSSLLNGAALIWPRASVGAACMFATGMLSLLAGVVAAMLELRESLDVVQLETRLVSDLTEYESNNSADREDATEFTDPVSSG